MAFAAGEVEDGTGLSTAIVYEAVAPAVTWLDRRGYTALGLLASDALKEKAMIMATAAAEKALRPRFGGQPIKVAQSLLFPARGAYRQDYRLIDEDEVPIRYLEAIRLLANSSAQGKLMVNGAASGGVRRDWARGTGTEYFDGFNPASFSANHPQEWGLLAEFFSPV